MSSETVLDINEIRKIIPHRYPFLFVDRVIEMEKGNRLVGVKQVSSNEDFFNGHFPVRPVMPGVLVIEALAQCAAILAKCSPGHETAPGMEFFLAGLDDVKWRRQVIPGDTLTLEVTWVKRKRNLLIIEGKAFVDGEVAASATIKAAEAEL